MSIGFSTEQDRVGARICGLENKLEELESQDSELSFFRYLSHLKCQKEVEMRQV